MRCRSLIVASALAGLTAFPGAAQEFKPPSNLFGQKAPAPKPPQVDWNWRPQVEPAQPAKPSVVCGMTVVPADPKIDPKMALKPQDTGTKYTLKIVEPTVCKP
jgi:hypothetical protein